MKLAKEGFPTIAFILFTMLAGWFLSPYITYFLLIPLGIVVWFFRDPERTPDCEEGFVSPADGVVVELEESFHEYTGKAIKIGIFMNAFNVHVNRFPTDATVGYTKYVPGKKWFAIAPKASEINERFYVGGDSQYGRFVLTQIAGILARRIVCKVKIGDKIGRANRYGMIKLGSKVDLYLPESIKATVKIGDKVIAGKTIVGR
ncbi:MAG: phosphatidylserine decarboxylase [Synergistaceae bacterium]